MKSEGELLWEQYRKDRSSVRKGQLLSSYAGLVSHVVRRFSAAAGDHEKLLESSDLAQAGMIGLLDAIEKFDPGRGIKFETYAMARVHGAIQDQLRAVDWLPRSERKKLRLADEVLQHLRTVEGDDQAVRSFAEGKSLTTDEYYTLANNSGLDGSDAGQESGQNMLEKIAAEEGENPFELSGADELHKRLYDAVTRLPKRERLIMTLHYYEGLKFTLIARVLKMSESRVSQIHSAVIRRLREECGGPL